MVELSNTGSNSKTDEDHIERAGTYAGYIIAHAARGQDSHLFCGSHFRALSDLVSKPVPATPWQAHSFDYIVTCDFGGSSPEPARRDFTIFNTTPAGLKTFTSLPDLPSNPSAFVIRSSPICIPSNGRIVAMELPYVLNPDHSRHIKEILEEFRPDVQPFELIYKSLHQDPELSCMEARTSKIAADRLRSLGYRVIDNLGGHGVVGLLDNGPGNTVLLRAEMDALPVLEKTGLAYASTKRMADIDGEERPTMHACGHDMHVAGLMATATLLRAASKRWRDRLLVLFQPNEERGDGARAMLADGLYGENGVPKPDFVLGQHIVNKKAGTIQIGSGAVLAGKRAFKVRITGRGGHASTPHRTIDPVVTACYIVIRLQTIVSREIDPSQMVVLGCGTIHAGNASNVIPDKAELTVDIRAYSPEVLNQSVESMKRIIRAECKASGAEAEPDIEETENVPPLLNSSRAVAPLREQFQKVFGDEIVHSQRPDTASDDFGLLAPDGVPYAYWTLGSTDPDVWDRYNKEGRLNELPVNHSPFFAPAIEPTLRNAMDAMSAAALTFLTIMPPSSPRTTF